MSALFSDVAAMKRTALSPCASTADGAAFKTSVCVRSLLATTRSAPFLSRSTFRTQTPRSFHVALPSFGFSKTKALQRHLWSSVSPSSPFDASIFSGAAGAGASVFSEAACGEGESGLVVRF